MADRAPWDDIDLATALDTCRSQGTELPPEAAIAVAIGVMRGVETGERLQDGAWCCMVHGRIQPSLVRLSAAGEVSLDSPGPLCDDLPRALRFVAPEVAGGMPATPCSDVFSIGALLFEMLTGQPIVAAPDPIEAAREIEALDPVALLHPHRQALGDLAEPLRRSLSPDPNARFPTPAVLAEHLQPLAGDRGAEPGAIARFLETVFRSEAAAEFDDEPALPGVATAFAELASADDSLGDWESGDASDSLEDPLASEVVLDDGQADAPRAPWELHDDPIIAALGLEPFGGADEAEPDDPGPWPDWTETDAAATPAGDRQPEEPSPWEPETGSRADGEVQARSVDPEDEEALTSQVRGGAYLFADGRRVGPLPLLDMDRELARVRDPAALVAFEEGKWRPIHECSALPWRPPRGDRRSFGLLGLGPLLLEIGAASRLQRVALWSEDGAAMLELGRGRVWRAAADERAPLLRRLVRDEKLLATDSLPGDDEASHDEDMLRWLEGRRLLNAGQAARLRRRILRRATSAPFGWDHGESMVQDVGPCPRSAPGSIDLDEAIAFAVRDGRHQPIVEGVLYRERERDVVLVEGARERSADLPLNPVEARFVLELPDRQPLTDALVGEWHQGRECSFAMIFLCIELGLVRLE